MQREEKELSLREIIEEKPTIEVIGEEQIEGFKAGFFLDSGKILVFGVRGNKYYAEVRNPKLTTCESSYAFKSKDLINCEFFYCLSSRFHKDKISVLNANALAICLKAYNDPRFLKSLKKNFKEASDLPLLNQMSIEGFNLLKTTGLNDPNLTLKKMCFGSETKKLVVATEQGFSIYKKDTPTLKMVAPAPYVCGFILGTVHDEVIAVYEDNASKKFGKITLKDNTLREVNYAKVVPTQHKHVFRRTNPKTCRAFSIFNQDLVALEGYDFDWHLILNVHDLTLHEYLEARAVVLHLSGKYLDSHASGKLLIFDENAKQLKIVQCPKCDPNEELGKTLSEVLQDKLVDDMQSIVFDYAKNPVGFFNRLTTHETTPLPPSIVPDAAMSNSNCCIL